MKKLTRSIFLLTLLSALPAIFVSGCISVKAFTPFLGVAVEGDPVTRLKLERIAREFPVSPEIVLFYLQWPSPPQQGNFPTASMDAVWDAGAIPCLSWEPMYYEGSQECYIDYNLILNGKHDHYLITFAKEAKRWNKPFIIRFAHEMNLARYHWGTTKEQFGQNSPDVYRKMYRYIVNIFRREGATNVLWAFVPNAESVPDVTYDKSAGWNRIENYYPGNDYVDILGIDGYNWGTSKSLARDGWNSRWLTFGEIFATPIRELRKLSTKKPLVVFEMASTSQGGDKDKWFRDAFGTASEWGLAGLIWFQIKKEEDWRIVKSTMPDFPPREGESQKWLKGIMASER